MESLACGSESPGGCNLAFQLFELFSIFPFVEVESVWPLEAGRGGYRPVPNQL